MERSQRNSNVFVGGADRTWEWSNCVGWERERSQRRLPGFWIKLLVNGSVITDGEDRSFLGTHSFFQRRLLISCLGVEGRVREISGCCHYGSRMGKRRLKVLISPSNRLPPFWSLRHASLLLAVVQVCSFSCLSPENQFQVSWMWILVRDRG